MDDAADVPVPATPQSPAKRLTLKDDTPDIFGRDLDPLFDVGNETWKNLREQVADFLEGVEEEIFQFVPGVHELSALQRDVVVLLRLVQQVRVCFICCRFSTLSKTSQIRRRK